MKTVRVVSSNLKGTDAYVVGYWCTADWGALRVSRWADTRWRAQLRALRGVFFYRLFQPSIRLNRAEDWMWRLIG